MCPTFLVHENIGNGTIFLEEDKTKYGYLDISLGYYSGELLYSLDEWAELLSWTDGDLRETRRKSLELRPQVCILSAGSPEELCPWLAPQDLHV